MRVHLVNPSHISFGVAVITPRWLYVLAAATPLQHGDPILCDETLDPFDVGAVQSAISSASAFTPTTPFADTSSVSLVAFTRRTSRIAQGWPLHSS